MAYIPGTISEQIYGFIQQANAKEITNSDEAVKAFAQMLEQTIMQAISSLDVVIPPGTIVVAIPTGVGTNPTPLLVPQALK